MAYSLSNKCTKNLCKRIVLVKLIVKNVVTCFFWNTVYIAYDVWYDVKWCDVILQYIFNVAWVAINFKDHDGDKKT